MKRVESQIRDQLTQKHHTKKQQANAARNITVPETGLEMINFRQMTDAEKRLKKRADRTTGFFGEPTDVVKPKFCTYTDVFDELVE
jgi:hypothetical protein